MSETEDVRVELPVIVVIPVQKVIQSRRHIVHEVDVFAGGNRRVKNPVQDVGKFLLHFLAHAIIPLARACNPREAGYKHAQVTDYLCTWQDDGVRSRLLRLTEHLESKDAGAGKSVIQDLDESLANREGQ